MGIIGGSWSENKDADNSINDYEHNMHKHWKGDGCNNTPPPVEEIKIEVRIKTRGTDWDKTKSNVHTVEKGTEYSYCKQLSEQKGAEVRYNFLNSLQGHYVGTGALDAE